MSIRHDRRRRVLADDSSVHEPSLDKLTPPEGNSKIKYNERARRDHQPRLIDLLPTRYRALAAWLGVALTAVALTVAADVWLPVLVQRLHADPSTNLSLGRPLAVWLSSLLLFSGGLMSVLLYSIRRHRVDDYHGRYRVWLWAAAAWFILSLDETTSLHGLGQALCASWSARYGIGRDLVWITLVGLVLATICVRLIIEMRHCRLAVTSFMLGACALLLSVSVDVGWIAPPPGANWQVAAVSGRLVAHVMLLVSLSLYVRHVILDAEGLLPARAAKSKKPRRVRKQAALVETEAKSDDKPAAKSDKPEKATEKAERVEKQVTLVDPPQKPQPHAPIKTEVEAPRAAALTFGKPAGPLAKAVASVTKSDGSKSEPAADAKGNLSRAERKKLRREQRNQRQDDEDDRD